MALKGTANVKTGGIITYRCALDSNHRVPSGHLYQHYVQDHGCSDTGISGSSYHPTRKGGDEEQRWYKRDQYLCPICDIHGEVRVFRTLNTADEISSGDSLETHLTNEHGGS